MLEVAARGAYIRGEFHILENKPTPQFRPCHARSNKKIAFVSTDCRIKDVQTRMVGIIDKMHPYIFK